MGRAVRAPAARRRGRAGCTDVGSGSVLLVAVVLVALALALVLAAVVQAQAARSSARAAADLAALAAAREIAIPAEVVLAAGLRPDSGPACARAGDVAQRNGARLTSCSTQGDLVVRVEVTRGTRWGAARAVAAAGPASARISPSRP